MATFGRETELIPKVISWSPERTYYREVPLFKKMMDVYAICPGDEPVTYAYELKLRNWRRALDQATHYLLAADFVYLALPKPVAIRAVEKARPRLEYLGVGVLGVDGLVEEIVKPQPSGQLLRSYKHQTMKLLSGRKDKVIHGDVY